MKYIVLTTMLVLALIVFLPVLEAEENVIVFNQTGTYIKVSPLEMEVKSYGVVVNAYYNSSDTIVLVARPYINVEPMNVTFELWDYWTGQQIGVYNVSTVEGVRVVNATGNITVFYYIIKGEKHGPWYIAYRKPVTTSPYIRLFNIFLLVAVLVAFAGRGNIKDIGIGLLVYGILSGIIAHVFGVDDPVVSGIYVVSIIMGTLVLIGEVFRR